MSQMKSRRRTQHAFTLLELLVVIIVTAMLMGAACTMLMAVLRASDGATRQRNQHRSFAHLAEQLRADVRRAERARLEEEGGKLILEQPGGLRTVYESDGSVVTRQLFAQQEKASRERETFRLQSPLVAVWEVSDDSPAQLMLRLQGPDADVPAGWKATRVTALLGSDRRFFPTSDEEEPQP